jgi:predicted PurR-regulated permease PerM
VPTGIAVAVLLLAYQEFENRVLVQRIYGNTLRLPSIVVVIALLAGAELQGIVGALLALPAAAAIRVCVEHAVCLRRRRLSPPAAVQPSEDRR